MRRMIKLASPVLVMEKLPGALPAATVSTACVDLAGATVGRVGCWGRQAISPFGGGGGSAAHVQPAGRSTHARNNTNGRNPRNDIATPCLAIRLLAGRNAPHTVSGA
jgi:hypothetical protein